MPEALAYFNGQLVPARDASIPVYDAGFVLGATVTEQLRTFSGKLFRLDRHLARLFRSLQTVGIDPGLEPGELAEIATRLAAHNHALLQPGDDLGLAMFVTPGPYPTLAPEGASGPTIGMHTYPLPFGLFADQYDRGEALVIPDVRQVSPRCWPRQLKCRSRMHYYLADRQARSVDPGARSILLDEDGYVTEATTANLVIVTQQRRVLSPPGEKILPGISVAVLAELARQLDIPVMEQDLRPGEVATAAEVILAGTTPCLLPAVRLDGEPIGAGRPGPVYRRLLAAWSTMVGVDIAAQAARYARR